MKRRLNAIKYGKEPLHLAEMVEDGTLVKVTSRR